MNKVVVTIAQIAIGTVAGIVASDAAEKFVVKPIRNIVDAKREKKKEEEAE